MKQTKRFELFPDEAIILDSPKHWRNYIPPVLTLALMGSALLLRAGCGGRPLADYLRPGLIPDDYLSAVAAIEVVIMIVVLLLALRLIVELRFTRYYVTTRRVVSCSGWLSIRTADMLLSRIETISLSQRVPERLFNTGDVICISAGASLYLDDVYNASNFRQTIISVMADREEETENHKTTKS